MNIGVLGGVCFLPFLLPLGWYDESPKALMPLQIQSVKMESDRGVINNDPRESIPWTDTLFYLEGGDPLCLPLRLESLGSKH